METSSWVIDERAYEVQVGFTIQSEGLNLPSIVASKTINLLPMVEPIVKENKTLRQTIQTLKQKIAALERENSVLKGEVPQKLPTPTALTPRPPPRAATPMPLMLRPSLHRSMDSLKLSVRAEDSADEVATVYERHPSPPRLPSIRVPPRMRARFGRASVEQKMEEEEPPVDF